MSLQKLANTPLFGTSPRNEGSGSFILKAGLVALVAAIGALAYYAYKAYYLPAYGDRPEELAYLEGQDPRALAGGDLTHFKFGENSFAEEAANLPWQLSRDFDEGDGHFERPFKEATASTQGSFNDGLGPHYNRTSCEDCHFSDGRTDPVPGGSLLVRLSVPGKGAQGGPNPHPVYGGQFGDVASAGVMPEGSVEIRYEDVPGTFGDGTPYTLRKPTVVLNDLNYGPLGKDIMMSARGAPSIFGLGLLEAISDDTLLAWADPDDADGDGISGKVNRVWDNDAKFMAIGRFGWKAEEATLMNQAAGAAVNDMGVTNRLHPAQPCSPKQTDCVNTFHGDAEGGYEMSDKMLEEMTTYLEFLSVPARGHLDDERVVRGEKLFADAGCASCHKTNVVTGDDHVRRRLRGQAIQPFTDLLLHDMGEGLADDRPSFAANGREWRTAPLWGIGMVETVNGHTKFLHDGRARNLEEAILWHGGEAEESKEAYRTFSKVDRDAIIAFLKSL